MGDLKLLDVLIGLVLMMSILSLAASTIVEGYSGMIKKRARNLQKALDRMLFDVEQAGATVAIGTTIADTAVVTSLKTTPAVWFPGRDMEKKSFPSYLSPTAFADAVFELRAAGMVPTALDARLKAAGAAVSGRTAGARAAIEDQFEEAMERVSGMYKRWASLWLFMVGLAIAIIGNVSVFRAAEALWTDGATREAVVAAATQVDDEEDPSIDASDLGSIDATVEELQSAGFPVGWTAEAKGEWGAEFTWGRAGIVVGWLVTASLVTLGAPFWFDILGRLVALRSSGKGDKAKGEDKKGK